MASFLSEQWGCVQLSAPGLAQQPLSRPQHTHQPWISTKGRRSNQNQLILENFCMVGDTFHCCSLSKYIKQIAHSFCFEICCLFSIQQMQNSGKCCLLYQCLQARLLQYSRVRFHMLSCGSCLYITSNSKCRIQDFGRSFVLVQWWKTAE